MPFILSFADAIGFQSLLPAGKEALVMKAILAGGLVNLVVAVLLAPRFLGTGMAISVVLAEAVVCGALICIVAKTTRMFRKQGSSPSKADRTTSLTSLTAGSAQ